MESRNFNNISSVNGLLSNDTNSLFETMFNWKLASRLKILF